MRRALKLAWSSAGSTSPNPPVGCVVLDRHGETVGEGHTHPPGGPHAEVVALRQAGARAAGGTAVVTLEPCAHTGRTGPCVDALLTAEVSRVLYAVADPNPVAAGGAGRLRAAGVRVRGGLCRDEAELGAAEPWLVATRLGRPFVTWKYAATLDGRIAAPDGTSRWITGRPARADSHTLRGTVDAVLVGSGTVLADDPHLTARSGDGTLAARQPLRVVLDRRGRVPRSARVLDRAAGTLVLDLPDPGSVLRVLHGRGVRHVLLEGGGTLAGSFVRAGLVDRVVGYLAPALLGAGPAALQDAGIGTIGGTLRLRLDEVRRIGDDLRLTARPTRSGAGGRPADPAGRTDHETAGDPTAGRSGQTDVPAREE
ncbi:MAG TPA: bifunctional diaminohydroxyphosphoribosylaminopyrimidine deaminase/5-amino-6-(5-phosphoribosylamino)uracil reductase RibD [Mycobacteriales bacterium]|nr:bifunctional diaminohydroxyphosphoribosylaminopyrimidine deaminase/5-amino-6-(5-phosphoribosylamino)uracil reductase RibD [Mycobacteriales bacterium]